MTEAGFSPHTLSLLHHASTICAGRGVRLTDLRRQVLGLIVQSDAPTGAYELLDQLRATRHNAAPPTVYRALDFLLENGLIHRLESLAAFVGCVAHDHPHDHAHSGGCETPGHAAQFLICRGCRRVVELEDPALAGALAEAAKRAGFSLGKTTIEAEGLCAACA
jgi:Fur family zinc uptake transcriptional regulator